VRILALADNDDFKWAGPNEPVDLVVSCGDVYDSLILSASQLCSAPQVLAVKGNHDSAGRFPSPIIDVHLRIVTLPNGFRVSGFNGCFRYKPIGHFLYDQDEATRLLQQVGAADILITHNSPHGVHEIDDDVHQGFRGLSQYIRTHSPRLLVHGHQHVSQETLLYRTRVVGVYGHAFIEI
jgi:predicted phosphodiesterase